MIDIKNNPKYWTFIQWNQKQLLKMKIAGLINLPLTLFNDGISEW